MREEVLAPWLAYGEIGLGFRYGWQDILRGFWKFCGMVLVTCEGVWIVLAMLCLRGLGTCLRWS